MKFPMNYVKEEDLSAGFALLQPGECSFTVKQVYSMDKDGADLKSSKGDPMVKIGLLLEDSNGTETSIYEYLTPNTTFKAYGLVKAVGRKDLYTEEGVDFDQIKGLSGKCKVKIDHRDGFNDRNSISSYVPHSKYKEEKNGKKDENISLPDDDIPF